MRRRTSEEVERIREYNRNADIERRKDFEDMINSNKTTFKDKYGNVVSREKFEELMGRPFISKRQVEEQPKSKRVDVEHIITDKDEFEEYQREQQREEADARAHPKSTEMYDYPIGPERPPKISFREKLGTKSRDIKSGISSKIGDIKKQYKENKEYEKRRSKTEREIKASPEYLKTKAEHDLYMEEIRARKQSAAPAGGHVNTKSATISIDGYRSAYSGRSTAPRGGGFGGSYKSAYTGQMWGSEPRHIVRHPVMHQTARQPERTVVIKHHPMTKPQPIRITPLGNGPIPTIGNFGSSIPKVGGGGKKMETHRIGSGLLGSLPKIGKTIKHKGRVRSMSHKTHSSNIGYIPKLKIGEVPKIGFGLKKRGMKK